MSKILKSVSLNYTPVIIQHAPLSIAEDKENVPESIPDPIELNVLLDEARKQAQEILNQARQEADAIKEQAKQEAAQLKQQTYENALTQGLEEGRQKGQLEIQQAMSDQRQEAAEKAQRILALARQDAQEAMLGAEKDIVNLAMEIARNVLAGELMINSEAVIPIVRAALEQVKDQEEIKILVNADDYEVVLAARPELQKVITSSQPLEVMIDPSIGMGGCIIQTAYGSVDARIDTGLSSVFAAIKEVMP